MSLELDQLEGEGLTMMITLILVGSIVLYLLVKILQLASPSEVPTLVYNNSKFNRDVLEMCPILKEPYIPVLFWGKSGHIQTVTYAKIGRFSCPKQSGKRESIVMPDGATITYDIFQPQVPHESGDLTLFICPGIGNSSDQKYIQCVISYAQSHGYRVVSMNHLGAIRTMKITASRIYTYGGTDELAVIVDKVKELYPETKLIGVGFSMGANILLKYLGEKASNQDNFIGAFSGCQGYDVESSIEFYYGWESMRRGYVYVISKQILKIIRAHKDILFSEDAQTQYGPFDVDKILTATSPKEIDDLYCSKRAGFVSTEDYYKWCSCKHVMGNIRIPLFMLNALDDPLVPEDLLEPPRKLAASRQNVIFATTRHGGHLGYFEGGQIVPNTVTWIDRLVVQYCDAIAANSYHIKQEAY